MKNVSSVIAFFEHTFGKTRTPFKKKGSTKFRRFTRKYSQVYFDWIGAGLNRNDITRERFIPLTTIFESRPFFEVYGEKLLKNDRFPKIVNKNFQKRPIFIYRTRQHLWHSRSRRPSARSLMRSAPCGRLIQAGVTLGWTVCTDGYTTDYTLYIARIYLIYCTSVNLDFTVI